jgi:hypothetical protein
MVATATMRDCMTVSRKVALHPLELTDGIAQSRCLPVELAIEQFAVGARLGNAARDRMQIVVFVQLQGIELRGVLAAIDGDAAQVDDALEFVGKVLQPFAADPERDACLLQLSELLLRLGQQDRRLGGQIQHAVEHPR